MVLFFSVIIVSKERVVQAKLQDKRHQRQRDREKRQDPELIRSQVPRIDGHQKKSDRAVGDAAYSEDQRVLDRLLYLLVDRRPLPPPVL